jgi:hypothetical protein
VFRHIVLKIKGTISKSQYGKNPRAVWQKCEEYMTKNKDDMAEVKDNMAKPKDTMTNLTKCYQILLI